MQLFLVIHQLMGIDMSNVHPYYMTAAKRAEETANAAGAEFQQCWYDEESGLLVCEWLATDEEAIRETLKAANVPLASIHAVSHFSVKEVLSLLGGPT